MKIYLFLILLASSISQKTADFRNPVDGRIFLTRIGEFGIERVERPGISAHLHTGIDILPPNNNYTDNEPIFPVTDGVIISKRTDRPFAQLIIEHDKDSIIFWSVYEHMIAIPKDFSTPTH